MDLTGGSRGFACQWAEKLEGELTTQNRCQPNILQKPPLDAGKLGGVRDGGEWGAGRHQCAVGPRAASGCPGHRFRDCDSWSPSGRPHMHGDRRGGFSHLLASFYHSVFNKIKWKHLLQ